MEHSLLDKKTSRPIIFRLSVFLTAFFSLAFSTDYRQQKQREEVTVTAVEVPVRVFRNNDVVRGLTKDDFEIYENGVKQAISGFEIISRKISGPVETVPPAAVPQQPKPRLFLLIFDIFDYNDAVGEAIDYFFDRVLGKSDQIVILTEGRLLNIEPGLKLDDLKAQLKETLKRYKVISTQYTYRAYLELEEECDRLLLMIGKEPVPTPAGENWDQHVTRFYDNYDRIWRTYRQQFLVPDLEIYQAILKRIKPIKADKWAICFQQRELFPEIKSFGRLEQRINTILAGQVDPGDQTRAGLIKIKQQQLQQSFDTSKIFPSDRLKNLFEVNITLFDDQSEIAFSDTKVMDVVKQEVRIVLNLGKLKPGVYFLIIDALDKNANEKDVVSRMIEL